MAVKSNKATQAGMGPLPHEQGVSFRVWAPHAEAVSVVGDFNDWSPDAHPLVKEEAGMWSVDVPEAKIGSHYKYWIRNGEQELLRIDPWVREVTNSVGDGVVHDPEFDWEGDDFHLPPWNEMVIYEMHIGTFFDPHPNHPHGEFCTAERKLNYLKQLGVNVVELMPIAEFAGDYSWGYNPAHIFAVESSYGGPTAFKQFVKMAHRHGLGVILDVVYNHFGPSDLDLWQFDGWSENDLGGIYFYNDWRADTPWGATRPDYGRGEVRQFIRDNALMWLDDCHVDGLRYDMTLYMRTVGGEGQGDLPDGWSLAQWVNREVHQRRPGAITIAEDLQNNHWLTKSEEEGGAGFGAQWDAGFVHPVREAVILPEDQHRSMQKVCDALLHNYNGDPFQRVIYSESHDEVANGKARVVTEINPDDPQGRYAQKRSTLAAALVLTAPGVPMLFQGQEFLSPGWFEDTDPLDWSLAREFGGIRRLYQDLIELRRNTRGCTRGLCGPHVRVYRVDHEQNVIAYHRWDQGSVGDDVVVAANFSDQTLEQFRLGFPHSGLWKLRFNSDWQGYSDEFGEFPASETEAIAEDYDGFPAAADVSLAPYAVLIYSQETG